MLPKSSKTRKALLGSFVVAVIQVAAIVARSFDIDVPTDVLVTLTLAVTGLFGLDIVGHAYTDGAVVKNGGAKK